MDSPEIITDKAKRYSCWKYILAVIQIAYTLLIIFVFLKLGVNRYLASWLVAFSANRCLIIFLYLFFLLFGGYILSLPLIFYRSYILEHIFGLSNQKIIDWMKDQIKSGIVYYVTTATFISVFYYILQQYRDNWWVFVWIFWVIFSIILAKLTPVLIIPLFFKYKKISDESLRQRIINLAEKMKIKLLDVFEIDFSRKTLKANAAFVGIGNTKRVVLADTLRERYSLDEIEVIIAHEFAHYKLRHLLKLIGINSLLTMCIFYFIFKTNSHILGFFGLSSLSDIASLPLVFLYFTTSSFVFQPFINFISRRFEANADRIALVTTGLKEAFILVMEKLACQNLSDRKPHPIIKFFFFDHPPVDERIEIARQT